MAKTRQLSGQSCRT